VRERRPPATSRSVANDTSGSSSQCTLSKPLARRRERLR
jgi:hypothetical protein